MIVPKYVREVDVREGTWGRACAPHFLALGGGLFPPRPLHTSVGSGERRTARSGLRRPQRPFRPAERTPHSLNPAGPTESTYAPTGLARDPLPARCALRARPAAGAFPGALGLPAPPPPAPPLGSPGLGLRIPPQRAFPRPVCNPGDADASPSVSPTAQLPQPPEPA